MARAKRLRIDTDIRPLSEFRANAANLIDQIKSTRRPLVLTQHGRSAAVLVDAVDYEEMVEEIELLREVRTAIEQVDAGKGVANQEAKRRLRKHFRR